MNCSYALVVMQNPRGTLNPAWMSEPSLAALPPTSPSPAPAASGQGNYARTGGNPLPDLLKTGDVEVPNDVDAKETAGHGADERVEVGVPVGEQAGPLLELRSRRHFVRAAGRRHGFDVHELTGKRRPVVDDERHVGALGEQAVLPGGLLRREDR